MAKKDIVVIGASAGGMEALAKVVAGLPAKLQASVFVVWHTAPGVRSILPAVLAKAGGLPARHPANGDPIRAGFQRPPCSLERLSIQENIHPCVRAGDRVERVDQRIIFA